MDTQTLQEFTAIFNSGYRSNLLNSNKEELPGIENAQLSGMDKSATSALHISLIQQREQIARDLHDGIGSQLTHIISRLDLLAHKYAAAENQLNDLRDFASETVQQLRETIWILNQHEIGYGQLAERIRGLLTRISTDTECPSIRLTAYGETTTLLPPQMASSVFRIVQEGVNNALKYAHCTELSVCLVADLKSFTILISDNGTGFCPDEVTLGYGLLNMKARTQELLGSLVINSSEEGTELLAEFPLPPSKKYVI